MSMIHAVYPVAADDYTCAGEASADIKRKLKQLGVDSKVLRRVSVASYTRPDVISLVTDLGL